MSRYTVMGADCAGSWAIESTDDLILAALTLEQRRAINRDSRDRTFFICDENRDGGTVPEEEIEEALASGESR